MVVNQPHSQEPNLPSDGARQTPRTLERVYRHAIELTEGVQGMPLTVGLLATTFDALPAGGDRKVVGRVYQSHNTENVIIPETLEIAWYDPQGANLVAEQLAAELDKTADPGQPLGHLKFSKYKGEDAYFSGRLIFHEKDILGAIECFLPSVSNFHAEYLEFARVLGLRGIWHMYTRKEAVEHARWYYDHRIMATDRRNLERALGKLARTQLKPT